MTSLETLPLEIHEQIFAYLVPRQRHKNLACLDPDYRNAKERHDIYDIRLTCRRLRTAALQTFVWILEDLPTKCQERTLRNLATLLELPEISSRLTYLTLSPYHLLTGDRYSYSLSVIVDSQRDEFHARCAWLRDTLSETLVAIIRLAPKIRHLVCVIASLSLTFNDEGEDACVGTVYSEAVDPMHIIQTVLRDTHLAERLESMYLLSSEHQYDFTHTGDIPESLTPLTYDNLRHLTLALRTRKVSDFRIRASHLTSLCIVLGGSCEEDLTTLFTQGVCFPELCPTLRSYTIRGDDVPDDQEFAKEVCEVPTRLLLQFIAPIFERDWTLPLVSLEHIISEEEEDVELTRIPDFQGSGRIGLLVFRNFYHLIPESRQKAGTSIYDNTKTVDHRWKPYEALLAKCDSSRIEHLPGCE